jgi:transglutaminase-like putative cysteine protease
LLREASYSLFKAPIWGASKKEFASVTAERDENTWKLRAGSGPKRAVTIASYLEGGAGVLAVPHGVAQLDELPVYLLETNRLGVIRAGAGPGFVRFRAHYDAGGSIDAPPDEDDLQVPLIEQPAVLRIADELKLRSQSADQALRTVARFFAERFQYSAWQGHGHVTSRETALAAFLLKTHSGHCEYFATATTLLLREAGIPARYAVGYAVLEKKGRQYVVRERHAHAWCLAWINGAWREIDTTPTAWSQIESSRASWWETVSDLGSRLWYEFSKWRWGKTEFRKYLLWLVVPLVLLVGARLLLKKQWRRSRAKPVELAPAVFPGLDSEFYQIERKLVELGLERQPGETLSAWLQRSAESHRVRIEPLPSLLALHYRLRFDPNGLSAEERTTLRQQVDAWLETPTAIELR